MKFNFDTVRLVSHAASRGVFFLLLSGCVVEDYIRPNEESLTEKWRCYARVDWGLNQALGDSLRGKSKVRLSRFKEGSGTGESGTVSVAGVTFQANYELVGTTRFWRYQSQGRDCLFGITVAGQGFSAVRGKDGEWNIMDSNLMCASTGR